jgi:hypothetical protein
MEQIPKLSLRLNLKENNCMVHDRIEFDEEGNPIRKAAYYSTLGKSNTPIAHQESIPTDYQ